VFRLEFFFSSGIASKSGPDVPSSDP